MSIDYLDAPLSFASVINDRCDIVGPYNINGVGHGYLLRDGNFTSLDYAGATFTNAIGINDRGVIVGRYLDAENVVHGYRLRGQKFTSIDVPGATFTGATSINRQGDILGRYMADGVFHGFLLSRREGHARHD